MVKGAISFRAQLVMPARCRSEEARKARKGIVGLGRGLRVNEVLSVLSKGAQMSAKAIHEAVLRKSAPRRIQARGIRAILQRLHRCHQVQRWRKGILFGYLYSLTDSGKARLARTESKSLSRDDP